MKSNFNRLYEAITKGYSQLFEGQLLEEMSMPTMFRGPSKAEAKRRKAKKTPEELEAIVKRFEEFKKGRGACVNEELVSESMRQAKEQYVKTGKIPMETVKRLAALDPTDTNKYVPWICKMYLTDKANVGRLGDMLATFENMVQRGVIPQEERNFNRFAKVENMSDVIAQHEERRSRSDIKSGVKSSDDVKKRDLVFENDKVIVAMPHTVQDSQKYGRKGRWCVSAMGNANFFEYYYYVVQCNLYYIIPKVDVNKLVPSDYDLNAIAIPVNTNHEFVELQDANNTKIDDETFMKVVKALGIDYKQGQYDDGDDW